MIQCLQTTRLSLGIKKNKYKCKNDSHLGYALKDGRTKKNDGVSKNYSCVSLSMKDDDATIQLGTSTIKEGDKLELCGK